VECTDEGCDDPDCKQTAGNAFWVVLPLMAATASAVAAPSTVVALPPRAPRRATILLVDDVATNRLLIAAILRREGHRVDLAESGAEAVRLAACVPYDLIFMDLNMPGMGGCEAAERIHALGGPAAGTKIVALTGSDWEPDIAACRAAGMVGVLAKPVRPIELMETIARLTDPRLSAPGPTHTRDTAHAAASEPAAENLALIDTPRLAELQQGLPPGLFASLFEQCLTDIQARLPVLRGALDAGDPATITSHAHALAGMAGSYGLAAVEKRMRGMMRDASAGNIDLARAAAAGIDNEVDSSADTIRAVLRAQAA
jgi:CheY-like chemotaxis protein